MNAAASVKVERTAFQIPAARIGHAVRDQFVTRRVTFSKRQILHALRAELLLPENNTQIFASRCRLHLPTEEELAREINCEREAFERERRLAAAVEM